MKTINNIDELTDYALSVFNGWEEIQDIKVGQDLAFHIVVKGESWDGNFDQRTAEIVLSVYNSLEKIYIECSKDFSTDKKIPFKKHNFRVIAKTENGSLDLSVIISRFLEILPSMTSTQLIILCAALGGTTLGGMGINTYRTHLLEKNRNAHIEKMKDKDNEAIQVAIQNTGNAIERVIQAEQKLLMIAQKPYIKTSTYMDDEDELYVPMSDVPLTKENIKKEFALLPTTEPITRHYIDGRFIIQEWKNIRDNVVVLFAVADKKQIKNIVLDLNETDKTQIGKHLDNREEISLQVTVAVQDKKITEGRVIAINDPRPNSETVSEATQ